MANKNHVDLSLENNDILNIGNMSGTDVDFNMGTGDLNTTGRVSVGFGTAATPSIYFGTDVDTGFYRSSLNTLGFAVSGGKILEVDSYGILVVDGAVGAPSYTFINDDDTGFYRIGADNIGITLDGLEYDFSKTTFDAKSNIITTTGNVGIGTSNPDRPLEIRNVSPIIRLRGTLSYLDNVAAYVEFGGDNGGNWIRTGYVGDGTSRDTSIYLVAEVGDLKLGDSTSTSVLTLSGGDATFIGNLTTTGLGDFGSLVVDTTTLVVNASGYEGRVGIGVTDPHSKLEVVGAISSATITITASSDSTDVSGVNTIFINPGAAVAIGGFIGGVVGQVLYAVIVDDDQNVTINHAASTGNQDIFIHAGANETLDSHYGGWIFICDGNNWYGTAHERHS